MAWESPVQSRRCRITNFALLLTSLIVAVGCSSHRGAYTPPPPPPSLTHPPIFPGGTNLKAGPEPSSYTGEFERRITYDAPVLPDQVMEYYKGILLPEGWTGGSGENLPNNRLAFRYSG